MGCVGKAFGTCRGYSSLTLDVSRYCLAREHGKSLKCFFARISGGNLTIFS